MGQGYDLISRKFRNSPFEGGFIVNKTDIKNQFYFQVILNYQTLAFEIARTSEFKFEGWNPLDKLEFSKFALDSLKPNSVLFYAAQNL